MNRTVVPKALWALTPFVLVLALFASTFVAAPAGALLDQEIHIIFYSDASYTQEVGFRIIPCEGRGYLEGTRTQYSLTETYPCP